jgi:DNA polymerase III sliding clamp (beta) subunit (PCNA family)
MVTISTSELKRFIASAKHIRDTRVLPIYGYVKMSYSKTKTMLYKSNGHSFVTCEVDGDVKDTGVFIIEEKTLFGFIDYCSGKEIKIKEKKGTIEI